MLTSKQIDFYRTFGFVVLRGFLSDRAQSLRAEVDSALRDAYCAIYTERDDDGIGVAGVKFASYFDELTADNGALRFVPGSHHPEQNARLTDYRRRQMPSRTEADAACYQASIPGCVADTVPGDVVAFDLHVWHSTAGGRDRQAWTVIYQSDPQTSEERDRTLRSMNDSFEQAFRGFDRDRYPVWRDWLADAAAHPGRAPVIERMRQAGVLDQPGAMLGW